MAHTLTALADPPAHIPPELVVDFDMYAPPGAEVDFHRAWADFRSSAPGDLVWSRRNGGHWIALRGPLIRDVMADPAHFSSRTLIIPKEHGGDLQVLPTPLDPPEHTPYRALLNPGLSPKSVHGREAFIRSVAVQLIDAIRPRGSCDFVADYADHLPIRVFMNLVDLPMDEAPKLKALGVHVSRPDGSISMADVMQQLRSFMAPHLEARRRDPGPDMLTIIANGRINGELIDFEEALSLAVQLLLAGLDTVVNFLGFAMNFLGQNPDHRRQLVADPVLIPAAVDELLRRFGINTMAREVTQDYDFNGIRLAQGDVISAPTFLHGLDEREFANPFDVDFHRVVGQHSTFGNGRHRCPGSFLARTEARITLEEWLKRIPDFEVDPDRPAVMQAGVGAAMLSVHLRWAAAS